MIAETWGSCISVLAGSSAFLYLVIKWTVNVTCVSLRAFIATNFVLGLKISGLRVPCLRVPVLRAPESQAQGPDLRIPGPRSLVPGLGPQVLILAYDHLN